MTGHSGMLPSGTFFDARDVMDMGEAAPMKPAGGRRRTDEPAKRIEDHQLWMAIVWKDGRAVIRSSPDMKQYKHMVLRPEAEKKFLHVMTDYIGTGKRQETGKLPPSALVDMMNEQMLPYSRKATKRRHTSIIDTLDHRPFWLPDPKADTARIPGRGERKVPLLVKDLVAHEKWFGEAFKAVQQVGCRTIAKVWIKKIHPKKQSTHPYNGGLPRDASPDPGRTRPPYWPANVIHKEPDHIDRNARTALLVHLIMHTPQQQLKASMDDGALIYAVGLLQALEEKKADFKEDRWAIIQEIIGVREQLERFNDGSEYCDPSTVIHVTDFSEPARAKNETDADGDDDEKADLVEEQQPTSTSASGSSNSTAAPSPTEPVHHCMQQAMRDPDEKVLPHQQRSARRLTHFGNEARLGGPQPDFDMAHGLTNDFMATTTSQSQQAIPVDATPYPRKPGARMGSHMGPSQPRQTMAFHPPMIPRQQHELALQEWMTTHSPTEMLPVEYTFNGMQCQTQMPNQAFHMDENALANGNREMMGASIPILESMPFQSFPDHSRPLQHRTMSASHAAMLASAITDSGDMFYQP